MTYIYDIISLDVIYTFYTLKTPLCFRIILPNGLKRGKLVLNSSDEPAGRFITKIKEWCVQLQEKSNATTVELTHFAVAHLSGATMTAIFKLLIFIYAKVYICSNLSDL